MGIDAASFSELVSLSRSFRPKGRSLMLGRQNYFYRTVPMRRALRRSYQLDRFQMALDRNQLKLVAADLVQADGFAEKLLEALGFGKVEALDASDFEAASLIWDLNTPVPQDWHGQFDFIFDGGTIEHVFNAPMAFENIYNMLAVGGRFVAASPMNGWPGHGIYQFGPELVWSYWHRAKRCKVHRCVALSRDTDARLDLPDAAPTGRRTEWTDRPAEFPAGAVYLWYDVEKSGDAPSDTFAQQSDYVKAWSGVRGAEVVHLAAQQGDRE